MWQRREQNHPEPQDELPTVAGECEAFLEGTYVAYMERHHLPVPAWAWLNRVAHGSPDVVAALASAGRTRRPPGRPTVLGWHDIEVALARHTIERAALDHGGRLDAVQHTLLIPLELAMASGQVNAPGNPGRFLLAVHAALHQHPTAG